MKTGRPSKNKGIDSLVVRKLIEAFKNDFTIEEACSYAGISKDSYYRWLNQDQEFSDEMSRSKYFVGIEAKKVIKKAIERGNLKASQWYLERKQKDLYGLTPKYSYYEPPQELTPEEENELNEVLEANLT